MRKTLSIFILVFTAPILNAQYFVDNLFVRYQWSELRKYKRLGINKPPLKCTPNSAANGIWIKAEQQLSKHNLELLQQNRWDEEIMYYKACIKEDSSFCDAYIRLTQCLVERTDWAAALNLLNLARRKFPNDPLVYLGLGQAYLHLHFPDLALRNFEKVIVLSPTNAEGYLGLSMVAYEMGRIFQSLGYLRLGYKKVDGDLEYLRIFEGILLYHGNRTQVAYDMLEDLQKPKSSSISSDGIYYATFEKTGVMNPQLNALVEYYLGLCCAAKGEDFYDKAIHHFKIARREGIMVDSAIAKTLGFSVFVDDLKEQLLSTYQRESAPGKKKSDPKADEAFENRKIDDAVVLFSKEINQDSLNLYPYFKLAECYQLKQEPQKALVIYKLAANKYPKDDRVKMKLVRQLVRADSFSTALKLTLAGIDEHPSRIDLYFQSALMMAIMKNEKGAIKLVKKLELEYVGDEHSMPWKIPFILGQLSFFSRDYGVALGYFNYAIQNASVRDPYLNYYYAKCLGVKGQRNEAKKYFYNAMDLGAIIDKDSMNKFQLVEKQSSPYGDKY